MMIPTLEPPRVTLGSATGERAREQHEQDHACPSAGAIWEPRRTSLAHRISEEGAASDVYRRLQSNSCHKVATESTRKLLLPFVVISPNLARVPGPSHCIVVHLRRSVGRLARDRQSVTHPHPPTARIRDTAYP